MMKKRKCTAVLAAIILTTSMNTFASVSSFERGYGFAPDVSAMKKAGADLDGKVFDGSEMHKGDYILPEGGINHYEEYYNGLKNMYVWQEYTENGEINYKKVYGGTGTFVKAYTYAECGGALHDGSSYITALTNKAINEKKGGPYIIAAADGYVSYGYYDVDLKGYNKLTMLFSSYSELPELKLQLVQNKADDSDICEKSFDLAAIEPSGYAKLFDSTETETAIVNNGYYNNANTYYVLTYILDGRTQNLKHSVTLSKYSDGEIVGEIPMTELTGVDFDVSRPMGFRLEATDKTQNDKMAKIALDEFKLEKVPAPLALVTTQESLKNEKVSAAGGKVIFSFDNTIDKTALNEESICVKDIDGNTVPVTFKVAGKRIQVTFGELKVNSKYTVYFNEITPAEGSAYTGSIDIYTSDYASISAAKKPSEGSNTAEISVKNNTAEERSYVVLLTVYGDGKMLPGVYYTGVTVPDAGTVKAEIKDIKLPVGGTVSYKAYLIDSFRRLGCVSDYIEF